MAMPSTTKELLDAIVAGDYIYDTQDRDEPKENAWLVVCHLQDAMQLLEHLIEQRPDDGGILSSVRYETERAYANAKRMHRRFIEQPEPGPPNLGTQAAQLRAELLANDEQEQPRTLIARSNASILDNYFEIYEPEFIEDAAILGPHWHGSYLYIVDGRPMGGNVTPRGPGAFPLSSYSFEWKNRGH